MIREYRGLSALGLVVTHRGWTYSHLTIIKSSKRYLDYQGTGDGLANSKSGWMTWLLEPAISVRDSKVGLMGLWGRFSRSDFPYRNPRLLKG